MPMQDTVAEGGALLLRSGKKTESGGTRGELRSGHPRNRKHKSEAGLAQVDKKKTDAKTGNAGKIRKSERRRVGLAMTYVCDKTAEYVPSRLS